jgi:hypothetical protein
MTLQSNPYVRHHGLRLRAPAKAALARIQELARDYVTFLHPVRKLTEKVRASE